MPKILNKECYTNLARELADAAGITPEQAMSVLKVMHIDKLEENMASHRKIMSDLSAVNALNMSQAAAKASLDVSRAEAVTLKNLRMAIKPKGIGGIAV